MCQARRAPERSPARLSPQRRRPPAKFELEQPGDPPSCRGTAAPASMESLLCTLIKGRQMEERMELKFKKANHVRRNLFGPVDHDSLQQEFQHMLYTSMEKAKRRWNFDFAQEMPAEGLLHWEELKHQEVPAFYHACVVGDARRPLQPMNRAVVKEARAQHTGKVKSQTGKKLLKKRSLAGKKRKDTFLTDYYTAKKKQIRVDMQTPVKKLAF